MNPSVPSEIVHHLVKAHHFTEPVKQGWLAPEKRDEFYDKQHFQIGTLFFDSLNAYCRQPSPDPARDLAAVALLGKHSLAIKDEQIQLTLTHGALTFLFQDTRHLKTRPRPIQRYNNRSSSAPRSNRLPMQC